MITNNYDLGPKFKEVFSEERMSPFIEAIRNAYDNACESLSPEFGDDKFTFGNKVWRFAAYEIKKAAKQGNFFKVTEPNNRLKIVSPIGDYTLGVNKIGHTGKEEIDESFPNNMSNVVRMAELQPTQLSLFQEENVELESLLLRNVILGHMGNAEDGLCTIYICMPVLDEKENFIRWGYTQKIWDRDIDGVRDINTESDYTPVPEISVARPILVLKTDTNKAVDNE